MTQFIRNHKWAKIFTFWTLFFGVVTLWHTIDPMFRSSPFKEEWLLWLFASLFVVSVLLGGLLVFTCMNSVKGRIKRVPYFFGLLLLWFVLQAVPNFLGVENSENFVFFMQSYFFFGTFHSFGITVEIQSLTYDISGLELPTFIKFLITGLVCLSVFYPFVVLTLKRLRDINLSSWFSLLTLIPVVSFLFEIFLCFKGSAKYPNSRFNKKKQLSQ